MLIDNHNSIVPEDRAALEALPGVGRKTANVVLNEAFGHPTIAVDTHIFRVGNRTGMAPGKTPDAVEKELLRRVPKQISKGRTSLAYSAWPICLQGAQAGMFKLRDFRLLPI